MTRKKTHTTQNEKNAMHTHTRTHTNANKQQKQHTHHKRTITDKYRKADTATKKCRYAQTHTQQQK